jgi:RNA polymerase sigma factor (sigma-70 family)
LGLDNYTIEELLDGIKNKNNTILKLVYKEYFPLIRSFILQNSGSEDDAKDIFQEAIIAIYKKSSDFDFEITSSFKTFLYSICRQLWLKQLRNRKIHLNNIVEITERIEFDNEVDESLDDSLEKRLFRKHFNALNKECQKLLRLAMQKVQAKDIARLMGYSEQFVRNRKYRCKGMLAKLIKDDPEYIAMNKKKE